MNSRTHFGESQAFRPSLLAPTIEVNSRDHVLAVLRMRTVAVKHCLHCSMALLASEGIRHTWIQRHQSHCEQSPYFTIYWAIFGNWNTQKQNFNNKTKKDCRSVWPDSTLARLASTQHRVTTERNSALRCWRDPRWPREACVSFNPGSIV